uniref:Coiled-coil domain-containing protein 43 n=1 Tax=Timema genevievae TaxID=629358 RepID=A0A7R9JPF4_TIMGE|nr:unnamed protein product [Timema genevievae]
MPQARDQNGAPPTQARPPKINLNSDFLTLIDEDSSFNLTWSKCTEIEGHPIIVATEGTVEKAVHKFNSKLLHFKTHKESSTWYSFATSHGKGAVDGIGPVVERVVCSRAKQCKVRIDNAEDFVAAAAAFSSVEHVKIIHIFPEETERNKEMLDERWKFAIGIDTVQSLHFFKGHNMESFIVGRTFWSELSNCRVFKLDFSDVYLENNSGCTTCATSLMDTPNIIVPTRALKVADITADDFLLGEFTPSKSNKTDISNNYRYAGFAQTFLEVDGQGKSVGACREWTCFYGAPQVTSFRVLSVVFCVSLPILRPGGFNMPGSEDNCAKCSRAFFGRQRFIWCSGPCKARFHLDCLKINDAEYEIFMKSGVSTFKCDPCIKKAKASFGDATLTKSISAPALPEWPMKPPQVKKTFEELIKAPSADREAVTIQLLNSLINMVYDLSTQVKDLSSDNAVLKSQISELIAFRSPVCLVSVGTQCSLSSQSSIPSESSPSTSLLSKSPKSPKLTFSQALTSNNKSSGVDSKSVVKSPAGSQSASASADDGFTVVSSRKNKSSNSNVREDPPVQRSRARKLLTVKEDDFPMINISDIWPSGCLIAPYYGKLLPEQIVCEESPCVSAPVNAAVASDLGSQEDSTRTPLVSINGAGVDNFDSWLSFKLRALNTDENVFGSYIKGILEGEETLEDKTEALEGILSEMIWKKLSPKEKSVDDENAKGGDDMDVRLAKLLESQPRPTTVQRTYTEEERKIREAILAQYSQELLFDISASELRGSGRESGKPHLFSQMLDTRSLDLSFDENEGWHYLVLNPSIFKVIEHKDMSDEEESGGGNEAEPKENGLTKNTNASVVQQAEKEKREKSKLDSQKKKDKDKEDRERQKQQALDKKEKRKTQKGERRR